MKRPTSRPTSLAMVGLTLATTFIACAKATGELHGHDQEQDTTPPTFLGCGQSENVDAGTGAKWSDLYRDLFGPTSSAKCASPACHGSNDGVGFKTAGFACFSEKECRQGMFDFGLVSEARDPDAPENSALIGIIRHCDESGSTLGTMPQQPRSYYFSQASLRRIEEWIRAGAPDN